jgi:hypothetical protein
MAKTPPPASNKPEDFPQFDPLLDEATVQELMGKLNRYLHNITTVLGLKNPGDLTADQTTIYEILKRIEQRRVYFHIYHPDIVMGELNEGALICFWILKLMPFHMNSMPNSLLNTKVAYCVFVNMVQYVAKKSGKKMNIKSKIMDNMLYAFQYRDLSKEAIMALAEAHLY